MSLIGVALAATTVTISHTPVDCLVKGRTTRIVARLEPAFDVAEGRVYFRRTKDIDAYAVEMALKRGAFEARLPKPNDTTDVVYFIEVLGQDGAVRRTAEMEATVVSKESDCPEESVIGEDGGKEQVAVLVPRGTKKAEGFGGISRLGSIERASVMGEPKPGAEPKAADPKPTAIGTAAHAPTRPASVEDYRVGPGDILRIQVYGHEDLTQVVTVQTDGSFTFPLLGRVAASDTNLKDLQSKLAAALGKGFVRNPQVTVVVQEYHSQSVFVVGEVARPGTYALQGETTVVEILAKAGPTQNAGHEVVIVRPRGAVEGPVLPTDVDDSGETAEVVRVNVREIRMGKLEQNVVLQPRDTVFVTEAAKVFVSGEVRNGGAYTFNPGMTARQAISMAGGFTAEASSGRIRVVREVDGEMREVKIKIDDPLEPGDTIVVKSKLF